MQKRCFSGKYLSCVMRKNPGPPSEGVKFFLGPPWPQAKKFLGSMVSGREKMWRPPNLWGVLLSLYNPISF